MKRYLKALLIMALFMTCLYPLLIIGGKKTDAYKAIESTLMKDKELQEKIGIINDIDIDPLRGYSMKVAGDGGDAEMHLIVKGSKQKVRIDASANKIDGIWMTQRYNIAY